MCINKCRVNALNRQKVCVSIKKKTGHIDDSDYVIEINITCYENNRFNG